jgi:hypothetical protein
MAVRSKFEFIDHSTIAHGKALPDPEQRHRARVAVMKNYRARANQKDLYPTKSSTGGGVKSNTTRWRLLQGSGFIFSDQSYPNSQEAIDEQKNDPITVPRLLDSLPVNIDSEQGKTKALCHYYLQSYWTNSIAGMLLLHYSL